MIYDMIKNEIPSIDSLSMDLFFIIMIIIVNLKTLLFDSCPMFYNFITISRFAKLLNDIIYHQLSFCLF